MESNAPTPLTSASQISKWDECQRKWGFQYLAGLQTPQTPAQLLGDEVDKEQLQPYLTTGRAFDSRQSGEIAASILDYLPAPKTPGMEVQKHFVFPSASSIPGKPAPFGFQGYIDLWLPNGVGMPGIGGDAPIVSDFKSTSDLKWAKKPAHLAVDNQAMLYATWAMFATGSRVVDLVWLYMQTRGARKARRVHLRVHADDVLREFTRIDATAVTMKAARDGCTTEPEAYVLGELKPNPEACEKFGGCPYRHKCNLGPADTITALAAKDGIAMNGSTLGLLERLKKERTEVEADFAAERQAIVEEPALGINPPEKDLPPPPVEAAEPAPAKKRGRPPTKKDPVGADVHAAISTPVVVQNTIVENKQNLGSSVEVPRIQVPDTGVQYEVFIRVPVSALPRVIAALESA